MQDFQQRVVDEKAELDEKIKKLSVFLETKIPLPLDEHERLKRQLVIMEHYSLVLNERITAFTLSGPNG